MASESLNVPEEHLRDVIRVIKGGVFAVENCPEEVKEALLTWCREEEEYLRRCEDK